MPDTASNGNSHKLERIELGIAEIKSGLSDSVDKLTHAIDSLSIRIIDEDKSVSGSINKLANSLETLNNQLDITMQWQEKSVPMRLVYMIIFTVILAFAGGAGLTYIKMLLHIPM